MFNHNSSYSQEEYEDYNDTSKYYDQTRVAVSPEKVVNKF